MRYQKCFITKTRDTSIYAYHYMAAQLRLSDQRHFTKIGQTADVSMQNIQHFMSQSPWDHRPVLQQIQKEISQSPALQVGGFLLLDESAVEKAGTHSVGAAPQYNGRLGKVEMSQVGTFLAFAHLDYSLWTWVDGELFLPEAWFANSHEAERKRLGIPTDRKFATKVQLGWQMIQRVRTEGLPFEAVACDALYGRADWFRHVMHQAGVRYIAAIDADTRLAPRAFARVADLIWHAKDLAKRADTVWQTLTIRPTERGHLTEDFACLRVFTWRDGQASAEWLVLRRNREGKIAYSLCNAPENVSLEYLARLACVRYFVERANQDAKSELGWDELRAQKWRAWEHHLALTVLASWFIAETKLSWSLQYPPDPILLEQLETDRLPQLSVANVREMLRAVMPLPQLTSQQATEHVLQHLFQRNQSRTSRLRKEKRHPT